MRQGLRYTITAGAVLLSCESDHSTGSRAPRGLNGPAAEVPASQVISGFKHGRLRKAVDVGHFSISKNPVTVAQFRTCIDGGPCVETSSTCSNMDGHDEDAALCVGIENAHRYCAWSGGRLPRMSEWLLAARGRTPHRFAWGDGAPTCEQHPAARSAVDSLDGSANPIDIRAARRTSPCGKPPELKFRVGLHEAGASPHGLEDVLISNAELVLGYTENNFVSCRNDLEACVVYGLIPGSIDAVKSMRKAKPTTQHSDVEIPPGNASSTDHPYAFRCTWTTEEV